MSCHTMQFWEVSKSVSELCLGILSLIDLDCQNICGREFSVRRLCSRSLSTVLSRVESSLPLPTPYLPCAAATMETRLNDTAALADARARTAQYKDILA